MAKIQTSLNEQVFTVKKWLGVNQALEGETRLKYGEAADMRNFKITAGGALVKRGGSKNVAGLMQLYIPYVRSDTTLTLFTEYGNSVSDYNMYPRMSTDTVGNVIGDGTPVGVNSSNYEDHIGEFYTTDNQTYQLTDVDITLATGDERVDGGAINLGALTRITSGSESTLTGETVISGTQSLTTKSQLTNTGGIFTPSGTSSVQARALQSTTGWMTQNVGGFVELNGTLYKYYGAKTDTRINQHKWKKYHAVVSGYWDEYYTQGSYTATGNSTSVVMDASTSSPSFNSSTGVYTARGTIQDYYAATGPSTVYYVPSNGSHAVKYTKSSGSYVEYVRYPEGPYSDWVETYAVGTYMNDLWVTDGERPESSTLIYVTTTGGYIYMRDNSNNYYAFIQDSGSVETRYDCGFGWYGYPVTAISDRSDWMFHPTYSVSNVAGVSVQGIWSGFVNGVEILCAACNGFLWQLSLNDGVWTKTSCGALDTTNNVFMFGFGMKLYILNGIKYYQWDGTTLTEVEGYRPLVSVAVEPSGGGTLLEQVNKLNGLRRCRFSPDGTSTVFQLPEKGLASIDYCKDVATGTAIAYTGNVIDGTLTFATAPAQGVSSIEVGWTHGTTSRSSVLAMRFAEFYNGAQDTRVFLYGDGSNKCFYSGLDYDGNARADYFPDMNECAVGDANTPITSMIRHYNKLLCFKMDSAWSIGYDAITLETGTVTAGFYISSANKSIGNEAYGQAVLVENRPRTLDSRSVVEWVSTSSSGNITGDQRNAKVVSERVRNALYEFDLSSAKTFYDKKTHEYYVIGANGVTLVNNTQADAWYIYTDFAAKCIINYKDEVYYGTADGYLRHFSNDYFSDEGEEIDAYWESGALDFGADYKRKYSATVWIGIKPEENGYLEVSAETDRKSDFADYEVSTESTAGTPTMTRLKLKAKKFTYYKLILKNDTADKTATVVSADIRIRATGYVR